MRHSTITAASAVVAAVLVTAVMTVAAVPVQAACTRLGFSVNDYGKDGPTKDAKVLLDKYVAKWATDHGVTKYRTGTKDVKCELFLNFIVFDEHTCRAEATVCWDGAPVTPPVKADTASASDKAEGGSPAAAPKKRAAAQITPVATAPAKPPAAPDATVTETGTLPTITKPVAPAPSAAAVEPTVPKASPAPKAAAATAASSASVADQALAAANKAAAAAERAAAAAERAAAAATAAEKANTPAPADKP